MLQGWAVVDNTGDEDWEQVELTLMAGLPVSFVHDLYNPRYLRRPVVEVLTEAAVAPVIPEEGFGAAREMAAEPDAVVAPMAASAPAPAPMMRAMSTGGMARREAHERSAAVQTVTKEVGELFEYRVQHPVTVRRNQSALVPILHRPFEGRRVLLYNRATREKNPLACLELRNTTGLTLEGGPVTVTEGDTYVGEAMLDTMKPEDRRLVPYAVELGFVVSVEDRSEEGPVRRAMVSHGVLTVEFVMMRRTHYHLRNKAKRAQILFLEHPRTEGWRLDQVGAPDETTDHYWRFTRGLAAGGTETFTVTESSGRQRTYLLANTGLDEVSFFLSSGFIDERVARSLREIISLRERVARRSEEVRQRTEERAQLFKDQERIRANIESLKSGTPQRELVARFVTKLNEQEDRLEGIARELERLAQEQREAQEEVNRQIQRLAFSTEPGKP
ncbi:hypothetical protein ACN28S_63355 [Cystobacter fuscus]